MRSMRFLLVPGVSAAALSITLGCTASAEQVAPPNNKLFFPTGMAVTPGDAMLFVANANSELVYDSGTISPIDLANVDQIVQAWTSSTKTIPEGCSQDTDHTETLICPDSTFIQAPAAARVGNFATAIAVQDTHDGKLRLVVPTRGDPSIAWVDWDGTALSCNANGEAFALCDDAHRLTFVHNDPNLEQIPDEPYDVYADSDADFATVTHLTTGSVTLIDSPRGGTATIADVVTGIFQADPTTGLTGATGIAGRKAGSDGAMVYVGARSENRIQMFTVAHPLNGAPPYLISGNWFFLDAVGANAGSSFDTRGIEFSASGDRAYVINRNPASLQVIDTSLSVTGFPTNKLIAATSICRQASKLAVMDSGDGDRAYVTCFSDGALQVVDPRDGASVIDVVAIGRGPYAIAASPLRKKVYVTNFLENTVAVVDVAPDSPLRDRVVLRIGIPTPQP